ncbi:hypothetical protein [Pseudomonas viridiflava]|uniref:hypothetical protein n=2 Tax=Pseudomonas viridiflava TaxID=33069 RepID=UPI000F02BF8D|nr:hypothetical protein [Pseudomonas viridiflava]
MDSPQQALADAYRDVLKDLPQHWLDRSRSHEAKYAKLSGLFIGGISPAYLCAPKRILVVGRETRRWEVLKGDDTFESLEAYICKAMATQQDTLASFMARPKDRGESFFNLLRDLATNHGTENIAWANLFSFAWGEKSPMRWEHFPTLLKCSEQLLKVQIEILQPDIIIFANGASSARFRRGYFPHKGESSVCSELGDFREQGIPLDQLWRFKLHEHIQCFRIQHPSSISAASRAARRFLLEQLRGNYAGV